MIRPGRSGRAASASTSLRASVGVVTRSPSGSAGGTSMTTKSCESPSIVPPGSLASAPSSVTTTDENRSPANARRTR